MYQDFPILALFTILLFAYTRYALCKAEPYHPSQDGDEL